MTPEERLALQEEMLQIEIERLGLIAPFAEKLQLFVAGSHTQSGRAEQMSSDTGSLRRSSS